MVLILLYYLFCFTKQLSYSTVYAISLPLQSDCSELDTIKSNYIKGMVKNLQLIGVSLQNNNNKSNNVDWEIIYNVMVLFSDNSHFEEMFKFSPSFQQPKWFNIGYDALLECLNYYLVCVVKSLIHVSIV